ncbi:MAG: 16S rRNA processing protein RimM [Gemmatimonadetes bacterium]|nr:16S rRNA processing protein RimM [Gemmatimonadota bacterium]MBI3568087.1 16S rRNA processing protein RimM [Gemmatimonadota bacterium]
MTDSPELLAVGRIRRAHGVRGEVVVELLTDEPDAIFAPGRRVFAGTPNGTRWRDPKSHEERTFNITGVRPFQDGLLVTVDAIGDRNVADQWRNHTLLVPRDELSPPDDGEVYEHELEGLAVVDAAGAPLGSVSAWYRLPNGLLLDVRTSRGTVSVPYNERFVVRVDRAARTLTMDIPDDLFPDAG